MHILITAKAKLCQLYQCAPLIVGDKYTDCEIMSFLGAKLTKDFPEPSGPPVYVLSATPLAVMDALQERGFELKLSSTVDGYISWLMSKPMEKLEEACSAEDYPQRANSPAEPRFIDPGTPHVKPSSPPRHYRDYEDHKNIYHGPCAQPNPNAIPQKNTAVQRTRSRENGPQDTSTQTVETHAEGSQTEKHPESIERQPTYKSERHPEKIQPAKSKSETSQPEKTKSDGSYNTEQHAKKSQPAKTDTKSKPKPEKHTRHSADSVIPPAASTSDSEIGTVPITVSSDSSIAVRKSEKNVKRAESPSKKKKKQSAASNVANQDDVQKGHKDSLVINRFH
uniref:p-selectin glycoprotein ligand 1 n=1 Tax=Lygus hesperus TaxID=30085 RepID=A0A0A9WXI6_LYGHE